MPASVLVTGGTGTLGRLVTPGLRDAGCDVRVLSRRERSPHDGVTYSRGDLLSGEGLDAAFDGARVVVHLAGGPKGDDVATRRLVRAASRAQVQHLLSISVVAADRLPIGFYRAKVGAELAVAQSGLPWTTLRAAQFHDLVLTLSRKLTTLPVVPYPAGVRLEPVDTRDVAARLVTLALGEPAGRVPDLRGPRVYAVPDLIRAYLAARGESRRLLPVRIPGRAGRVYRAGENLAGDDADTASRTWEDFLSERVDVRE